METLQQELQDAVANNRRLQETNQDNTNVLATTQAELNTTDSELTTLRDGHTVFKGQ